MAAMISTIDCKLPIIGNASVGKSSLLAQFFDKKSPTSTSTTVGFDFRVSRQFSSFWFIMSDPRLAVYALQVHEMDAKGKKVKLSIWVGVSTSPPSGRMTRTEVFVFCRTPPAQKDSRPSRLPTTAGHRALFWVCSRHPLGRSISAHC